VQSPAEEQVVIDGPIDTNLALGAPAVSGSEIIKAPPLDPFSSESAFLTDATASFLSPIKSAKKGSADDGQGNGGGGDKLAGLRIAEPQNAVRVGSFSVWSWPIIGKDLKKGELFGEPGAPPKVGQEYHIVIRIHTPPDQKRLPISDLSGEVVGTDGYHQRIPDDAYYYDLGGDLVRAQKSASAPVIRGIAEILIRVPAAHRPAVKDTIKVHSKVLKEDQKIELVFQSRVPQPEPNE
jgi:hypothetical protein